MMMHMYPYNNLNFNSFEGESSLVQAQGFAFQQQQNWNLYSQLALDPFLSTENFDNINVLSSTDQNFSQYNFQQNFDYFNIKKKSDHIYSKFTIPSITSIISQQSLSNNNPINTMNFLSSLSSNNNNDLFSPSPPSIISSIPSNSNSSIELDFNYNDNQNSIHSSNSLSYFNIPDKDTTISLQDIIDGMKVMQEISKELTSYHNSDLDYNLLHDIMNYLVTDLNENQIDWLIHENLKELSKHVETNESNEILNEKQDELIFPEIDDLIEEHMIEIKKIIHNEILCQEILTETSSLEYQDLTFNNPIVGTSQIEDSNNSTSMNSTSMNSMNLTSMNLTTTTTTTTSSSSSSSTGIIKQEGISQETVLTESSSSPPSPSSSNMFVSQENDFSYNMLTNSMNLVNPRSYTADQRTLKCNEIGCSKEYNCYAKLKSHKVTHTNDKPYVCNVLGCNKRYKRSGELIKHQLDHLN